MPRRTWRQPVRPVGGEHDGVVLGMRVRRREQVVEEEHLQETRGICLGGGPGRGEKPQSLAAVRPAVHGVLVVGKASQGLAEILLMEPRHAVPPVDQAVVALDDDGGLHAALQDVGVCRRALAGVPPAVHAP